MRVSKDLLHYIFAPYSFKMIIHKKPYSAQIRDLAQLIMKSCRVNTLMHSLVSPSTISEVTLEQKVTHI